MKYLFIIFLFSNCFLSSKQCRLWYASKQSEINQISSDCDTLNGGIEIDFGSGNNEDPIVDLSPLKNIKVIIGDKVTNGFLELSGDASKIKDFSGFENLTSIDELRIVNLTGVKNLIGFKSLKKINENLGIYYSELESLKGLEQLKSIGNLEISNSSLVSIDGLEAISEIDQYIEIIENKNLIDINSFNKNIKFTSNLPQRINISGNPLLSVCSTDFICNNFNIFNRVLIFNGNAEGCNSYEEVEQNCLKSSVEEEQHTFNYHFISDRQIKFSFPITKNDVALFNTLGKDLSDKITLQDEFVINLQNLKKGFYILRIGDNIIKLIID